MAQTTENTFAPADPEPKKTSKSPVVRGVPCKSIVGGDRKKFVVSAKFKQPWRGWRAGDEGDVSLERLDELISEGIAVATSEEARPRKRRVDENGSIIS